mgnify:CR=1 FL=1
MELVGLFPHHVNRQLRGEILHGFGAVEGNKLTTEAVLITLHVFIIELYRIQEGIQG